MAFSIYQVGGPLSSHEQIRLDMTEAVGRLLEDRRIMVEDVQQTVFYGETTGRKFVNPATGRSLAFYRPDRVTFWVEYSMDGERCRIHTAYSHRMEMKRGPHGGCR